MLIINNIIPTAGTTLSFPDAQRLRWAFLFQATRPHIGSYNIGAVTRYRQQKFIGTFHKSIDGAPQHLGE